MSRYAFDLSARTKQWAEDHAITAVKVEQMCARPKKKKDDSDDDDDEGDDDEARRHGSARVADYIHDETHEEDLEIWAVVGTAPFKRDGRQEVSQPGRRGLPALLSAGIGPAVPWCPVRGQVVSRLVVPGRREMSDDLARTQDLHVSAGEEGVSLWQRRDGGRHRRVDVDPRSVGPTVL